MLENVPCARRTSPSASHAGVEGSSTRMVGCRILSGVKDIVIVDDSVTGLQAQVVSLIAISMRYEARLQHTFQLYLE